MDKFVTTSNKKRAAEPEKGEPSEKDDVPIAIDGAEETPLHGVPICHPIFDGSFFLSYFSERKKS